MFALPFARKLDDVTRFISQNCRNTSDTDNREKSGYFNLIGYSCGCDSMLYFKQESVLGHAKKVWKNRLTRNTARLRRTSETAGAEKFTKSTWVRREKLSHCAAPYHGIWHLISELTLFIVIIIIIQWLFCILIILLIKRAFFFIAQEICRFYATRCLELCITATNLINHATKRERCEL